MTVRLPTQARAAPVARPPDLPPLLSRPQWAGRRQSTNVETLDSSEWQRAVYAAKSFLIGRGNRIAADLENAAGALIGHKPPNKIGEQVGVQSMQAAAAADKAKLARLSRPAVDEVFAWRVGRWSAGRKEVDEFLGRLSDPEKEAVRSGLEAYGRRRASKGGQP